MNQIITNQHPPKGKEAILILKTSDNYKKPNNEIIKKISQETGATLLETIIREETIIGIQAESHITISQEQQQDYNIIRIEDFTCGEAKPEKITQEEGIRLITKQLGIKNYRIIRTDY